MNVGMMACYDQAKEIVAKITNDPMEKGPSLSTQLGSSAIAVCLEQCPFHDFTTVSLTNHSKHCSYRRASPLLSSLCLLI
jgi:hypothetical protein